MMNQAERLINRMLKSMSGTVKFKIQFLPVTVFNQEEQIGYWKDAAALGIPGSKVAYAATLGVHQADLPGLDFVEQAIVGTGDWTPLQSGYTIGGDEGGRPEKSDTDLGDAGEATRESGANENR